MRDYTLTRYFIVEAKKRPNVVAPNMAHLGRSRFVRPLTRRNSILRRRLSMNPGPVNYRLGTCYAIATAILVSFQEPFCALAARSLGSLDFMAVTQLALLLSDSSSGQPPRLRRNRYRPQPLAQARGHFSHRSRWPYPVRYRP